MCTQGKIANRFYHLAIPPCVHRGLSSVVRKCIHRETGLEYAVKIIDMTADEAVQYSVAAEIDVFQHLPSHKHISKHRHVH